MKDKLKLHYYQFQGLTKDLLAQIKAIPEFVKAEVVLGEKEKEQFHYLSGFRRKRSICKRWSRSRFDV